MKLRKFENHVSQKLGRSDLMSGTHRKDSNQSKGKRNRLFAPRFVPTIFGALAVSFISIYSTSAFAVMSLEGAFMAAFENDPQFQMAAPERDSNKAQAVAGWSAYIPTYTFQQTQMATDISTRRIETLSVPILDSAKAATVAQANSRYQFAKQTYITRVHDLAQRTLKAVDQWVLASEALRNNTSRIALLDNQYKGAKRKFELGEGTITDLRDIEVKFNMAKADELTLQAQKKIAARQVAITTGSPPDNNDFVLPSTHSKHPLPDVDYALAKVRDANPTVQVARENADISKYNVASVAGQNLPSVYFTNLKTQYIGQTTYNNGISVNFPLQVGQYVQTYAAAKQYSQADSQKRDTQAKTELEAERLHSLAQAGQEAIAIKKMAVDSAQLSVEANQKSFAAGVRSSTDVLNSIQVLFQTRNDYAQAVTQQAENYLNLLLIQADDPVEAIRQTQTFLFKK